MSKIVKRVHFNAALLLFIYYLVSNAFFFSLVKRSEPFFYLLIPFIYGAVFGVTFLFLFSHEDFFKFAKEIEKREMGVEKRWLKRFIHLGKVASTFAVGTVGGPVLAALAVRLLFASARYRYFLVILANIPSTLFSVGIAKGVISLFG